MQYKTPTMMSTTSQNNMKLYLSEIGKMRVLTDEEELRLSERAIHGDTKAQNELVQANLRYAVTVAKDYQNRGLAMDDLISEAQIGMIQAAKKFDASHGIRFVKFAAPFMRRAINKALDEQSSLYQTPKDNSNGSEENRRAAVSVDAPISPGANVSLLHVVEDNDALHADIETERKSMDQELDNAVKFLPEREQKVVRSFYGIGCDKLTYVEIGMLMGLKRERVRQILKSALRKVNRRMGKATLKSFLLH